MFSLFFYNRASRTRTYDLRIRNPRSVSRTTNKSGGKTQVADSSYTGSYISDSEMQAENKSRQRFEVWAQDDTVSAVECWALPQKPWLPHGCSIGLRRVPVAVLP